VFYQPGKRSLGLSHDPFKAIVAPRPIGWISSINSNGDVNLAPYSFFNAVSGRPPIVMFSTEGRKDTISFVEETREFVCNLATWELRLQVNATSAPYPRGVNEMQKSALEPAPSVMVKAPRIKMSPCALECRWLQTIPLHDLANTPLDAYVVFGQVVGIHIDDRYISNGLLDTAAMRPIARAGYSDYFVCTSETGFSMPRPTSARPDDPDPSENLGD